MVGRRPVATEILERRTLLSGGQISGTIFNDANGNSGMIPVRSGCLPLPRISTSTGTANSTPASPSRVTSSLGAFTFLNVAPAAYLGAGEVIPSGFTLTTPDEINLTVSAGSSATVAFGNQKAGAISGMVYSDFNGDGLIDGFDTGMSGGTVYIDSNNNGKLDAGEKSVKSLNAGQFNFFNLVPGTYTVREIPPNALSAHHAGCAKRGRHQWSGAWIAFGNQMLAIITGTVYNDINANSGLDTGEPHLPNVKLFLDTNQNGILDAGEVSTTSAADGTYSFTSLIPGTYRVAEVAPAGFVTGDPVLG